MWSPHWCVTDISPIGVSMGEFTGTLFSGENGFQDSYWCDFLFDMFDVESDYHCSYAHFGKRIRYIFTF